MPVAQSATIIEVVHEEDWTTAVVSIPINSAEIGERIVASKDLEKSLPISFKPSPISSIPRRKL
jgi:hypothetical protein